MKKSNIPSNVQRLPRPQGSTALAMEIYVDSIKSNPKKDFNAYMIHHWLLSNGKIFVKTYDINEFAKSLGVSLSDIKAYMRDTVITSPLLSQENSQKIVEGLMGEMITWAMEDRMRVNNQIGLLREAQGDTYKPFISAELNKAIKLSIESSTSLQSLVTKFMGNSSTNIFQIFNQNNINQNNNEFVTPQEVLEILAESNKGLDKPNQAKLIENTYDLEGLPEVVATKQDGVSIEKEGISKINVHKLTKSTDDFKTALQVSDKDHHEMRREIEMNIDTDAPDPELDIYEEYDDNDSSEDFNSSMFLNNVP